MFEGHVHVVHANDIQDSMSGFMSEFTSKSVPNFRRCVLEQDIGHELRVISDSFYLEFSGFVSLSVFIHCSMLIVNKNRTVVVVICMCDIHFFTYHDLHLSYIPLSGYGEN